jgi:hypothetical protein
VLGAKQASVLATAMTGLNTQRRERNQCGDAQEKLDLLHFLLPSVVICSFLIGTVRPKFRLTIEGKVAQIKGQWGPGLWLDVTKFLAKAGVSCQTSNIPTKTCCERFLAVFEGNSVCESRSGSRLDPVLFLRTNKVVFKRSYSVLSLTFRRYEVFLDRRSLPRFVLILKAKLLRSKVVLRV